MKTRWLWTVVVVILIVGPVMALEYVPTWAGQANTTYQKWTFGNGANPIGADDADNPYGLSQVTVTPAPGGSWIPIDQGELGVWPLSGHFTCPIFNIAVMDKELLIGGRWRPIDPEPGDPWMPRPIFHIGLDDGPLELHTADLVYNDQVSAQWYDVAFKVTIDSAVPFSKETIKVAGDFNMSTLRIDTLAIPEPVTMSLLALGGLALLRRRR